MKKLWSLGILLLFVHPVWAQEDEDEFSFSYYVGISAGANINSGEVEQATKVEVVGKNLVTPTTDFDTTHTNAIGQVLPHNLI